MAYYSRYIFSVYLNIRMRPSPAIPPSHPSVSLTLQMFTEHQLGALASTVTKHPHLVPGLNSYKAGYSTQHMKHSQFLPGMSPTSECLFP